MAARDVSDVVAGSADDEVVEAVAVDGVSGADGRAGFVEDGRVVGSAGRSAEESHRSGRQVDGPGRTGAVPEHEVDGPCPIRTPRNAYVSVLENNNAAWTEVRLISRCSAMAIVVGACPRSRSARAAPSTSRSRLGRSMVSTCSMARP